MPPLAANGLLAFPVWILTRGHVTDLLLIGGLVLLRCLFLLRYPIRKCRCGPGLARLRCRRCRGHGYAYRRGATAVHRFAWSVVLRRLMERRREAVAEQISERPAS